MLTLWDAIPTFDHVFDDVMKSALSGFGTTARFTPAVDVRARPDAIVFTMDVPGVKREDLNVTLEHRTLTVKGVRKLEANEDEQVSLGRAYGDFALSYTLPEDMDGDKLFAQLADGVLTIHIPKQPKAQPRRIEIGGSDSPKQLGE